MNDTIRRSGASHLEDFPSHSRQALAAQRECFQKKNATDCPQLTCIKLFSFPHFITQSVSSIIILSNMQGQQATICCETPAPMERQHYLTCCNLSPPPPPPLAKKNRVEDTAEIESIPSYLPRRLSLLRNDNSHPFTSLKLSSLSDDDGSSTIVRVSPNPAIIMKVKYNQKQKQPAGPPIKISLLFVSKPLKRRRTISTDDTTRRSFERAKFLSSLPPLPFP